ncbi:hypothetical protein [Brevundimonas sp. NIBR11]|uniref:hypothetical protein n=1 Tax=Brevundimonas sp. NIBR11 TaxID=3015999 RepID=UPI0022F0FF2C|nr:hypothetical protein [Brevundimonas sp. NIBR11]WGM30641.1 hypothetical protein KKHFBJBL_00868 [Brevundimonas sp. NIBR11]
MLIALALASVLVHEDPDGVVATAPRIGEGAVLVGAEAPTTDARPEAAQVVAATPHNLTTREQIQRWISARAERATPFAEATGPEDDREMHGFVSAGIGTHDYSSVSVGVSLPVGDNGRLDLAYSQTKNGLGYPGFGYGAFGYPGDFGAGGLLPIGRSRSFGVNDPFYAGSGRSRFLSLGFSWDKDRLRDDDDRRRVSGRPAED